jgi:microcystin-dependent protein
MSECYIGEIRMISFNVVPQGWALCNGQALPVSQNAALFSLLGTRFGGNGVTTFNLPDLRGRMPLHMGAGFLAGQSGGEEAHALTHAELPQHDHSLLSSSALSTAMSPANALPGKKGRLGRDMFAAPANLTNPHPASVSLAGASQPHQNMQPFLVLNFAIALAGVYPSRN